jgi:hypothetical protein
MPPLAITQANLKVFLEGPFDDAEMSNNLLVADVLPLNQPYNTAPWNYDGSENVTAFPNTNIVDWLLVELRESNGDASTATQDKTIARRAGFLMKDGSIRDLDGISNLQFPVPAYTNLYAVVRHRNHIGVMSALPLLKTTSNYTFDFSTSPDNVVGGLDGYNQLSGTIFGMVSGDGDANGVIEHTDKYNVWSGEAGHTGYLPGDFNLNNQVENNDKNLFWSPNLGKGSMVP